jgi:subtilisin-like proprotein convertase family protein
LNFRRAPPSGTKETVMKSWKIVMLMLGVLLIGASSVQAVVTNTSTPNVALLPDNGCVDDAAGNGVGGISDVIAFVEAGTISDVDVAVQFTHTWRSDIQAALSYTGGGGTVQIINNWDTSGDNLNAVLDSDAATLCSDAANCGTGTNCGAAPGPTCQPNATLDGFDGLSSPGTWTLAVCDRAAADLGNLVQWSVTLDGDGGLPVELLGFSVN